MKVTINNVIKRKQKKIKNTKRSSLLESSHWQIKASISSTRLPLHYIIYKATPYAATLHFLAVFLRVRESLGLKNIPAATAPFIKLTACWVRIFFPDGGKRDHGTIHGLHLSVKLWCSQYLHGPVPPVFSLTLAFNQQSWRYSASAGIRQHSCLGTLNWSNLESNQLVRTDFIFFKLE